MVRYRRIQGAKTITLLQLVALKSPAHQAYTEA
jgi:hypothetical protein